MTKVTLMPSGTKLCYMTQLENPERQAVQSCTEQSCSCFVRNVNCAKVSAVILAFLVLCTAVK